MFKRSDIVLVHFCRILLLSFSFFSCHKFEPSPYQTRLHPEIPGDLNQQNIRKLLSSGNNQDTIRFIVTGDTQRFYDDLKDLVRKTNSLPGVDFLVLAGDITDFGTAKEYTWIFEGLSELKVPYLCVIGNHDLVANGSAIYEKIFGEKNFSFSYKGCKFIFHDTNGREYGFNGKIPDMDFLQKELDDPSAGYFVGISHVPPYNEDFDKKLEGPYSSLLASKMNFVLSLHGHLHGEKDDFFYDDHVRYIVAPTVKRNKAFLIKLYRGTVINQTIFYE